MSPRSGPGPGLAPTRARLLQAARELCEEGGYGAAPVLAIADRAGVAAGTLYRHFPSKPDLFVELFRTVCDGEIEAMRDAAGEAPSAAAAVEEVLVTFAARALHNPRLAWALLAEPVDPAVDAERLAYRRRYAELLSAHLNDAIAAGDLPAQPVELTAAALVGGIGEALVGPLAAAAAPPDELLAALRSFVRRAVGAQV